MLAQPRVVWRTLDGEVEGQLQAVVGGGAAQPLEVFERAELRVQGIVAAFGAADGVRAAHVARLGLEAVVAALAVRLADGVDRREVEHVEAHRTDGRQPADHVVEGAMAVLVAAFRAREQLVPAGEAGGEAVCLHRHHRGVAADERAPGGRVHGGVHGGSGARGEQDFEPQGVVAGGGFQFCQQRAGIGDGAALGGVQRGGHQPGAFLDLQRHVHAGLAFLADLVEPAGEGIAPCFDSELMAAQRHDREAAAPAVVDDGFHWRGMPDLLARRAPQHGGGKLVVAVHPDIGGDLHALAHRAAHGKAAVVGCGGQVLDGDARRLHGGGQVAVDGLAVIAIAIAAAIAARAGLRADRQRFIQADIGRRQGDGRAGVELVGGV
ncbi:hypothetical protein D3C87_1044480 [compost metagenome]